DNTIVVVENIMRHLEQGTPPRTAALRGAKEIGFTVISITLSLLAVFIPILMMGGIFGRLFREFAVTLAVAVGVSLVVSLTTTPMMCAYLLRPHSAEGHGWLYRANEWVFQSILRLYEITLGWVLRHQFLMLLVTLATIYVTVRLYIDIPKGFFPQQDTGALGGTILADQSSSFQAMRQLLQQFVTLVGEDPAVENVVGSTGGSGGGGSVVNTGRMFIQLKPLEERQISADQAMARLRGNLARVAGHWPRYSFTPRHQHRGDRRYALRCLWPAAGLHHVQAVESVPCGTGSGVELLAESRWSQTHLCAVYEPHAGATQCLHPLCALQHAARRQSPGPVSGHHHLIQSRPRHGAGRRHHGDRAGHARDWLAGCHPRQLS